MNRHSNRRMLSQEHFFKPLQIFEWRRKTEHKRDIPTARTTVTSRTSAIKISMNRWKIVYIPQNKILFKQFKCNNVTSRGSITGGEKVNWNKIVAWVYGRKKRTNKGQKLRSIQTAELLNNVERKSAISYGWRISSQFTMELTKVIATLFSRNSGSYIASFRFSLLTPWKLCRLGCYAVLSGRSTHSNKR